MSDGNPTKCLKILVDILMEFDIIIYDTMLKIRQVTDIICFIGL